MLARVCRGLVSSLALFHSPAAILLIGAQLLVFFCHLSSSVNTSLPTPLCFFFLHVMPFCLFSPVYLWIAVERLILLNLHLACSHPFCLMLILGLTYFLESSLPACTVNEFSIHADMASDSPAISLLHFSFRVIWFSLVIDSTLSLFSGILIFCSHTVYRESTRHGCEIIVFEGSLCCLHVFFFRSGLWQQQQQ